MDDGLRGRAVLTGSPHLSRPGGACLRRATVQNQTRFRAGTRHHAARLRGAMFPLCERRRQGGCGIPNGSRQKHHPTRASRAVMQKEDWGSVLW